MKKTILIILLTILTFTYKSDNITTLCGTELYKLKQSEFTYYNLHQYLHLTHPELSEYIIRQFILETGWFKSKSFVNYNNLSGMRRISTKWNSTATGVAYGYCKYNHWTDSVDDYIKRMYFYAPNGINKDEFYNYIITSNYAENTEYVSLLKRINIKKFKNKMI